MENKKKLGISPCLLGEKVRYDGGHRLDRCLAETLGKLVEFVPVCPEVGCGLPVPREPMRLTGNPARPRLVTIETGIDHTERMLAWTKGMLSVLHSEGLCGFVFKANSPSCGIRGVPVYNKDGVPEKAGAGLFASAFMERFPMLPVEDEEGLHDPENMKGFIEIIST